MSPVTAIWACWVLGAGCAIRASDIPADFPGRAQLYPDPEKWLNSGDSVIVSPGGEIVAGPLHAEYGILYADCDPARASAAKRTMDVAGHYGRPDLFRLEINRQGLTPVDFAPKS